MRRFLLLVVLSVLSLSPIAGADCTDFSQYARWVTDAAFPGITGGVDLTDGHAYAVNQSGQFGGLTIYDIHNPLEPVLLGSTPASGPKHDVVVHGPYAYVTSSAGLEIIDVANPEIPIVLGSIATPDAVYGLDVSGDLVFVAAEESGLIIVDAGSPTSPVQIGHLPLPTRTRDVVVIGDRAYVANYDQLGVVDVSNPEQPVLLGTEPLPGGYGHSLAANGTHAYVGGLSSGAGLHVFDVTDPTHPLLTGSLTGFSAYDVELAGTIPIVAGSRGLTLVDPTDPSSPALLAHVPVSGGSVAAGFGFAYLGGGTVVHPDLRVVELGNFTAPLPLGEYLGLDHTYLVDRSGGTAFILGTIGTNNFRFEAIDVSNPGLPILIEGLGLGHHTQFKTLDVEGHLAAFSLEDVVYLVDVTDPETMELVGITEAGFGIQGIALAGPYLHVATLLGLKTYDLTDPTTPVELGEFEASHLAGLAIAGSMVYLCGNGFGLQIVDVTDPAAPMPRGSLPGYHDYTTVTVAPPHAYLAGPSGLAVVDVASPDAPFIVAELPLPGEAVAMHLHDAVVAVAMLGSQVMLYDVTDPAGPVVLGNTSGLPPSYAWSVAAGPAMMLVAADAAGLQLFPAQCWSAAAGDNDTTDNPSRQHPLGPVLNVHPSLGGGTATLSFSLRAPDSAVLRILDISGRTVRLLHSGPLTPGSHTRAWDGRDHSGRRLDSGVYFGQLATSSGSVVEKVLVTR